MKINRYHAAGGIVVRDGRVLLLHKPKKGETVLPKGHVEEGETLEAAALREVREETGFLNLRILANLGTERGEFEREDERVIRDETYFVMALADEARDEIQTHADAEHDRKVFEQAWVPLEMGSDRMTFEPAKTFVRRAAEWVKANEDIF